MTINEEFRKYLACKGISFSPCAFKDEASIPPKEDWETVANKLNAMFAKMFAEKKEETKK